jgi:hypothetical protein
MSAGQCPECGAPLAGGRAACQAVFDELAAQAYGDARYRAAYTLAFDTYCMQHRERYCRSAKSYAAHLTRLCCGLEYDGEPRVYEAIRNWLDGHVALEKPAAPARPRSLTVVDARQARSPEEHRRLVRAWAENVWEAYAGQHDLARAWIEAALAGQGGRARRRGASL